MPLAAFGGPLRAPYAPSPAADDVGIALFAGAFRWWSGDSFGWRNELAIAEPLPSTLARSTDQGDEWAENSVRNVRLSTNDNQFGRNGLENDRQ